MHFIFWEESVFFPRPCIIMTRTKDSSQIDIDVAPDCFLIAFWAPKWQVKCVFRQTGGYSRLEVTFCFSYFSPAIYYSKEGYTLNGLTFRCIDLF